MKKIAILSAIYIVVVFCSCQQKEEVVNIIDDYTVIPFPNELTPQNGEFLLNEGTKIYINKDDASLRKIAAQFNGFISRATGFELVVEVKEEGKGINFQLVDGYKTGQYELNISNEQIIAKASEANGIFYALQTIRQLLPKEIESKVKVNDIAWTIPNASIADQPRFEYRGMQMDVSRHFFSKEYLKRFIDYLAYYKFNKYHLHLTDDQGWRIEIKKFPKLTENGAWREINNHDEVCLERAKDNPDFALPEEFFKEKDGKRVYGGYYTQEDMKEVIAYAADNYIDILPEIDMPGHFKAAIDSYPDLTCIDADAPGWGKTFSIPICPCEENTYTFAEDILSEIIALFPYEYIHIGADEVEKTTWENNAACQRIMKEEGFHDVEQLQSYFVKRIEKFVNSRGKKMIGWDEVLDGGVNPSTTVMYWRGWVPDSPTKAIANGSDVIMTPTSHSYFDYQPDNGSLEHVYAFNPIPEDVNPADASKIKGVQANLWSEYIPTKNRLEYMAMPRMLSMAEVGWSEKKDFDIFKGRMTSHYDRMELMGINYRIPGVTGLKDNNVFVDEAEFEIGVPLEGMEVRYTTDGSVPTKESELYSGKIKITENTDIKIAAFKGSLRSDITRVTYTQQDYLKPLVVAGKTQGIRCDYYEGTYTLVKDIEKSKLIKSVVQAEVTFPDDRVADGFALIFKGLISVENTGIYTFYTNSDDGSTLSIGDRLVVDNDGPHGSKEKSGQVALEKGLHPITIKFFESGGGERLDTYIEGPGMEKVKIPASMLFEPK